MKNLIIVINLIIIFGIAGIFTDHETSTTGVSGGHLVSRKFDATKTKNVVSSDFVVLLERLGHKIQCG